MKGVQLKDYIARRWKSTPLPPAGNTNSVWQSRLEPSPIDGLFRGQKPEQEALIDRHFQHTVDQVLVELASGDLPALGRLKFDDGSISDPVWIDRRFWMDASFYYAYGAASDRKLFYDQMKVLPQDSSARDQTTLGDALTIPSSSQEVSGRRPGRPSEGVKILAAIERCSVAENYFDRVEWEDREKQYRADIKQTYKIDTLKVKKFETKTLKKYETIFRKKTGR